MKLSKHSAFLEGHYPRLQFPFRLLIITGLAIIVAAAFLIRHNMNQEQGRSFDEMKSRADVLIWALEGGVRSMHPGHNALPPAGFVEEVAKQPGIVYVTLVNENGLALVHSEREKTGKPLNPAPTLNLFTNFNESTGTHVHSKKEAVYEVVKPFTPLVLHRGRMMMSPRTTLNGYTDHDKPAGALSAGKPPYYIVVGVDAAPFLDGMRVHALHLIAISCLLVLASITSVALGIFIYNYNRSKRLLKDARSFTLQVFERLPIGVFATDLAGNITLYNRACSHILNFRHAGTQAHISAFPWFDWKYFSGRVSKGTPVVDEEYEFTDAASATATVSISAAALRDSGDSISGYLFIVRDLGEVKRLQKQVQLNERLSALGNLAAGVAHEIRNPLSTVKGYATYLAKKLQGNPAHETALYMIEEVERLNRVVSDLLGVARTKNLELAPTPLGPVIERALRLATQDAESRGVNLVYNPPALQDTFVVPLDSDCFLQALLNLTVNAIQATNKGGQVSISIQERDDAVAILITDTGIGMGAEVITGLFTPYFTTKPSGTGLGLVLSHQVVELHGGEIRVQSEPGKGSTFTILLPRTNQ